jgi:MFS family permease
MEKPINIDDVIRHTRRYWYVDGIVEISGGALILFIAVSYYLSSLIPNIILRSFALGLGQPVIIILGAIAIRKIITRLKETITYPRTGYLSLRNPRSNKKIQRIIKVVMVSIIVSISVSIFTQLLPIRLMPLITSFFFSLLTFYLGFQNRVFRFYIVAFAIIFTGIFVTIINLSEVMSFVSLFGAIGFLWIVSGGLTLIKYLHHTDPELETS